jgi:hypothetical protein
MTATLNDMGLLATDAGFQRRVQSSMTAACIAIVSEAASASFHRERQKLAVQIMNAPTAWVALFSNAVATDTNCSTDATGGGSYVALTTGNLATQAALVTDAHINTAVSSMFNSFAVMPAS